MDYFDTSTLECIFVLNITVHSEWEVGLVSESSNLTLDTSLGKLKLLKTDKLLN